MTRILQFISAHMGFLWRGARFRITGSQTSTSFGANALLFVEGERLRLKFVSDRDQLLLDLQSVDADPSNQRDWHSAYRVRRLMSGERRESAVLDESDAAFIERHLDEIEGLFSSEKWPETQERLKALGKVISNELFG